ncbi:domain of Kin17 curved DNA-binding protein-domain-containing protein [Gongronella butleri]|nr:domain of Kin17 curved DNA-binding protein-domain-containing protein [Gongronella butleri]
MTPKQLANRMKSKGLLKLKFYCQVCQKQCRDENGFKCHTMSESHQRQMLLVADNPGKYVFSYTKEFQQDFLKLLSRRHGTKRVFANQVYQEYIGDRNHIHMNSTRWNSLSEFVRHLGREGICRVDETERGYWIAWIDNSPEALARQAAIQKMDRKSKDDYERDEELLQAQIDRAKKIAEERGDDDKAGSELKRDQGKIKLNFNMGATDSAPESASSSSTAAAPTTTAPTMSFSMKKPGSSNKLKAMMGGSATKTNATTDNKDTTPKKKPLMMMGSLGKRKEQPSPSSSPISSRKQQRV